MIRELIIPRRLERPFLDISKKLIGVMTITPSACRDYRQTKGGKVIEMLPNEER